MSLLSVLLQVAAETAEVAVNSSIGQLAAAFGAACVVLSAAFGISKIGSKALESIARQPEAAGDIRSSMIVVAALIEGVAFLAVVICLLIVVL